MHDPTYFDSSRKGEGRGRGRRRGRLATVPPSFENILLLGRREEEKKGPQTVWPVGESPVQRPLSEGKKEKKGGRKRKKGSLQAGELKSAPTEDVLKLRGKGGRREKIKKGKKRGEKGENSHMALLIDLVPTKRKGGLAHVNKVRSL